MKKRELCEICLLNATCQHNFDYECQEVYDFMDYYKFLNKCLGEIKSGK